MVTLYVEGGSAELSDVCRKGFRIFLEKAGLKGRMPTIYDCGGRGKAYEEFKKGIKAGERAFLLVDSEELVKDHNQKPHLETWTPWLHFQTRNGDQHWEKPENSEDTQCHLMVVVMESWFLADREALKAYYGKDFHENSLPAKDRKIESLSKAEIYKALKNATRNTTKGEYSEDKKGKNSFELLAKIDPQKVMAQSPWAKRFIDCLRDELGA